MNHQALQAVIHALADKGLLTKCPFHVEIVKPKDGGIPHYLYTTSDERVVLYIQDFIRGLV